ncbi:MAG: hypothetical protein E6Q77_05625 [Rhizobium sp.]|nr:MAG: hypothetical protein E6Q77_05625 [Rhizobium sp.]
MAQDPSNDSHREKQSKQTLARIQHSKAQHVDPEAAEEDHAPLVADPRNRLADGEVDPATKELKPKGE